jgi:hypothetical protein
VFVRPKVGGKCIIRSACPLKVKGLLAVESTEKDGVFELEFDTEKDKVYELSPV